SATILRKLGGFCGNWDGVASARWDALWSGTKRKSGNGNGSAGRRLKKSPKRKAYHRLHRRKRTERETPSLSHLGPVWAHAGAAVPLHLEDAFGDGRNHLLEFLLPVVSRDHPQSADQRVSHAPASAYSWQVADRLGRLACASPPRGLGVRASAERTPVAGVSSRLRAGTESLGVYLGAPEAARDCQP